MKVLRIFGWGWVLSAAAMFAVALLFGQRFVSVLGYACLASLLGVMPSALLALICFVYRATNESIEARVASMTSARNVSAANGALGPVAVARRHREYDSHDRKLKLPLRTVWPPAEGRIVKAASAAARVALSTQLMATLE